MDNPAHHAVPLAMKQRIPTRHVQMMAASCVAVLDCATPARLLTAQSASAKAILDVPHHPTMVERPDDGSRTRLGEKAYGKTTVTRDDVVKIYNNQFKHRI